MLLEKIQTGYPAYAIEYINQLSKKGTTPLDGAYELNDSNPVKKEIIRLIRAAGGKSFNRDASGKFVGDGKGDLHSYEYVYASYKRKYPNGFKDKAICNIRYTGSIGGFHPYFYHFEETSFVPVFEYNTR